MGYLSFTLIPFLFCLQTPAFPGTNPPSAPLLAPRGIDLAKAQPSNCPLAGTGGADVTNECCQILGKSWRWCSGIWPTVANCYNLNEGNDCCADGSVCDTGLGCCSGTCCTSDTSTTICKDGSVCYNGRGCCKGTCCHGEDSSGQSESDPDGDLPAATVTVGKGSDTYPTLNSNPSSDTDISTEILSKGAIAGVAIGGLVFLVIVAGICVCCGCCSGSGRREPEPEPQRPETPPWVHTGDVWTRTPVFTRG